MQVIGKFFIAFSFFCTSLVLAADAPQKKTPPQTATAEPVTIQSNELIVLIPQSRDKLLAYSMHTNKWSQIAISVEPSQKIEPSVSRNMAVCKLGPSIYAYSAKAGVWSQLNLLPNSKVHFELGNDTATVTVKTKQGNRFYVFGASHGQWTGIDINTGEELRIRKTSRGGH